MGKKEALIDIFIFALFFWGIWSLRFFDISQSPVLTVVISSILAMFLLRKRKLKASEIGFRRPETIKKLIPSTLSVMVLTFLIQSIGIGLATLFHAGPDASSAITSQPKELGAFLYDIVINTWIVTAIGEEFLFRGFLLNRLMTLFPSKSFFLVASAVQAVWFGAGHASQGLSGIIITGAIGFVLAQYYLRNKRMGLVPLILSHAVIDTVVLTLNFFK